MNAPLGGKEITLTAADGHTLSAWAVAPSITPRAGLVIGQEMYGVNGYIRDVCAWYAEHGYLTIAPALYDRIKPGLTFAYTDEDNTRAKALYRNYDWDKAITDLEAARDWVARAGKVGMVGFCFGGSLAWMAACRSRFDCAVSFYGGEINRMIDEDATCPIECHVGSLDTALDATKIARFRTRHPDVPFHIYEGARHGFDNPGRGPRHHPEAMRAARAKTLAFLSRNLSR